MSANMKDITACVVCGKTLEYPREQVDTCGKRCAKTLLGRQRESLTASWDEEYEQQHGTKPPYSYQSILRKRP